MKYYMEISKASEQGYIRMLDGVERKTLIYGENTLLTEFRLEKGYVLPIHKHPQEQTGYLVTGHIILTIGDKKYDIVPGDSWAILGGVEHGAEILENSVAIEVFSPVRADYLP